MGGGHTKLLALCIKNIFFYYFNWPVETGRTAVLSLPSAQSKPGTMAVLWTSAVCASQIISVRCCKMFSQSQSDDNHPGGRCLYLPNKHFLRLITCEVSALSSLFNCLAIKLYGFWCDMNRNAHTHTKCKLTCIQQLNFLKSRKRRSNSVWQSPHCSKWTEQRPRLQNHGSALF